ncbi:hypothetical protein [Segniliparus rugosus]|uniref:Outer membrane channel protein CpnT-like N-terminal domain-containing protein n=1 Tax=Segniliparus rugosus (strain ATCC BAA-974 / DSM 45345 / CCUG 50838 / CIP 108380 / JCM 13579 / CDC 945) TaxID=679197 RepID=E5XKR2_SEGRC|nr:hypothetical protein [Segniliparus rugosus]EFV15055.1 hypothetical protein HMPREF9336_00081 [Segniliparus rugosus ATCC BAA-974]
MVKNDVEFAAYSTSSTHLLDVSSGARSALTNLASALQGSLGGAGGTDEAGREWSQQFDPAMKAALEGGAATVNTTGNHSGLLHASGLNHVKADAASTIGGGDESFPAAPSFTEFTAPSVPSADGGPNKAPMGGMVGKIWSWIEDKVGFVWPNGDPGKLQSVQAACQQAASAIDAAKGGVGSAKGLMGAQQAPEIADMLGKLGLDETDLSDLSDGLRELGSSAGEHATNITNAHNALFKAIEDFAIETAAWEVGGAILSVFTAGLGEVLANGAVALRLANLVRRLKELYEMFKNAVRATLAAIRALPGKLGAKVAAMFARGGKAGGSAVNAEAEQARLAARARDLHSRLVNAKTGKPDVRAQNSRTSAAMSTKEGKDVLAGGGRDLNPAQRAAAGPNDVVAMQPGAHAEVTAINGAKEAGLTPSQIAVSRPICDNCQTAIQESGGTIHPDGMGATWP